MRVGIIGAGVAGMAAAWDIVRSGHEVTIYEGGAEVGGLAAGFKDAGWDWTLEKFYHHWFETDSDILRLADELGVRDRVIFPRPKTSYWINGEIVRSEMNLSTLFLPISFLSKIRLGLTGVFLKFLTKDWRSLEQHTADAWMRRYMGEEAYGRFFRPLLIGKFAHQYRDVNMAWLWARIYTRSVRLGTFEGGFHAFMEVLADALRQRGVQIRLNTRVSRITPAAGGGLVIEAEGESETFDRVISTTSPRLTLQMTEGLADTPYGQQMAALESIGGLCVVLALEQSLLTDGTYWLSLPATDPDKQNNEFPFLALVEHTNFLPPEHYGGDHLIYCGDYVAPDHAYFQMREDELAEHFMSVLPRFNPDFRRDWVRKYWVFRAPYAQPVPKVNQSQKIPPLKTSIPGLYWASMSQVYPWDRGTNFAVEIGRRTARELLDE